MKKLFFRIMFLVLIVVLPATAMARVDVHISIPLPPPIVFPAPPQVVVIPETYVYAVPDVQEEIYFYGGWWWRPWQGRWYRSRYHDHGWVHNRLVPPFYRTVPPGWRNEYRDHRWKGHPWNHERINHQQLRPNWKRWQNDRHWERNKAWNVQGLPPRQHPRGVKSQPRPMQPQSGNFKNQGKHGRGGR